MNLASLQLPLLMRLVKSIGQSKSQGQSQTQNQSQSSSVNQSQGMEGGGISGGGHKSKINPNHNQTQYERTQRPSVFSWMWKYITKLTTTNNTSNAENSQSTNLNQVEGHIKEFGVYIEELNFTLKNSEFVNDTIVGGIKRVNYAPIVRLTLGGIYLEKTMVKEIDWEAFRIGVSSICVEPLADFRSDAPGDNNVFLETESVSFF